MLLSRCRLQLTVAIIVIGPVAAEPILNESGDLQAYLDGFYIPSESSPDKYRLPTAQEIASFRTAIDHVLDGEFQAAADEAVNANYAVVAYTDNISGDIFTLLREKNSNQHWGGLYVIDRTPERTLVVECPHPVYDGVKTPSVDIFIDTNATAFLLAGTHRNNSPIESDCDGDLGGSPYRISDMAHAPDSLFQAAHEEIEAHFTRTVSLNFHGMAEESDPADVVISNGTSDEFLGNSLSRALATRMNQILAAALDPRVAVSAQEPGFNPSLSGTNNTQGRATNRSPSLCHQDALFAVFPERFIHMECDPDVRSGAPSNWSFVTQALIDEVPLFSTPAPALPTGSLVITEFMPAPTITNDEYVELFNQTGDPVTMTGWKICDKGRNVATISGMIAPGDLFVLGDNSDLNGASPGGAPDAIWTDSVGTLTLTNTGDVIYILDSNNNLVTSVAYELEPPTGRSQEIITANSHRDGQTIESDYAASTTPFGVDKGSPGTRGASAFPLDSTPVAAAFTPNFTMAFPTRPAVTYTLWKSPDLGDWSPFQGIDPWIGDGSQGLFAFPASGDPHYFYQIRYGYAAPP